MENLPYFEVHTGRLVYQPGWPDVPPYEKGIDVRIGTDMVIHSFRRNADVVILVSGDTDYASAIQAVKDNGIVMEVALFGGGSEVLRKVADAVREIDAPFLEGCWR
ncbi:MAG: NYN domain-containing protein [Dehalococcoidia bacterium]|nr:NYN domain-containing protein [Dehalococcoidia bacterium]